MRSLHSKRYASVDLTEFFCGPRDCCPVVGGALTNPDIFGHVSVTYARTLGYGDGSARDGGYASVMSYDPSKVKPAPPRYQPADEAGDQEGGPRYDDDNPPTWKDFIKAANRARKSLKGLKD